MVVCFFVLLHLLLFQFTSAQIAYSKDFPLKEGLYLNFQQFRANTPLPKSQIVSELDKNELSFFEQITSKKSKSIKYINSAGVQEEVAPADVWGYSKNNGVYISHDGNFYRMDLVGSFCHFVANVITYVSTPDPFYGMRYGGVSTPVNELRQFVFDAEGGKAYVFNVDNMEELLKRDEALYAEFMTLKRRKRKDAVFVYLRKYNEKHPLYFPEN